MHPLLTKVRGPIERSGGVRDKRQRPGHGLRQAFCRSYAGREHGGNRLLQERYGRDFRNRPTPHLMLHGNPGCTEISKTRKAIQHDVTIKVGSFGPVLAQASAGGFQLGAEASAKDVWLSVDFADREFEEGVPRHVHRLLSRRYSRPERAGIERNS